MSLSDKLSFMPALLTPNLLPLQWAQDVSSSRWWDRAAMPLGLLAVKGSWWPYLDTKVSVFKWRLGTLFTLPTLSGDRKETRRVWWRRNNKPHTNICPCLRMDKDMFSFGTSKCFKEHKSIQYFSRSFFLNLIDGCAFKRQYPNMQVAV